MDNKTNYKLLNEQNPLKIEQDLYEIQRTIIHYGNLLIKEIQGLKDLLNQKEIKIEEPITKTTDIIGSRISKIKISEGYGGSNLKW